MNKEKLKLVLFIASGSILFLFLPLLFSPHPPEEHDYLFSRPTQRDFLANLFMLIFFFLNFYVLIDFFYLKKKFFMYLFLILLSFLIVCIVPSIITGHNPFLVKSEFNFQKMNGLAKYHPRHPFSFVEEIKHHIFLFAAVIFSSAFFKERDRIKTIENDKLQAELSQLKTQIHPHFLFNALNSIYSLSLKKDDKAAESIVKLAEFMRYLLQDANKDMVYLEKEVTYIDNYIDLQKARLRNTIDLEYLKEGDFSNFKIAPLLLFAFIENAFKYGVNPEEDSAIQIKIELKVNILHMQVMNNKVAYGNIESSKIGLQNTFDRLKHYYHKKYTLEIVEDENIYTVNLTIQL